jgi:hypothetical protein
MAASDYVPIFFKNRLHLAGRPQMSTRPRAQIGRVRVSRAEFAAADPDKDGTLSKDEYLALVGKRFNAADPDHGGTLTSQQFNSRAGLPLRRLL